jgi:hypothetical protein
MKGVLTIYSVEAVYFPGSAFWETPSYLPLRFCAYIFVCLSYTDQMRFAQSQTMRESTRLFEQGFVGRWQF